MLHVPAELTRRWSQTSSASPSVAAGEPDRRRIQANGDHSPPSENAEAVSRPLAKEPANLSLRPLCNESFFAALDQGEQEIRAAVVVAGMAGQVDLDTRVCFPDHRLLSLDTDATRSLLCASDREACDAAMAALTRGRADLRRDPDVTRSTRARRPGSPTTRAANDTGRTPSSPLPRTFAGPGATRPRRLPVRDDPGISKRYDESVARGHRRQANARDLCTRKYSPILRTAPPTPEPLLSCLVVHPSPISHNAALCAAELS